MGRQAAPGLHCLVYYQPAGTWNNLLYSGLLCDRGSILSYLNLSLISRISNRGSVIRDRHGCRPASPAACHPHSCPAPSLSELVMVDVLSILTLPGSSSAFSALHPTARDESSMSASAPRKVARLATDSDSASASRLRGKPAARGRDHASGPVRIIVSGEPGEFYLLAHEHRPMEGIPRVETEGLWDDQSRRRCSGPCS